NAALSTETHTLSLHDALPIYKANLEHKKISDTVKNKYSSIENVIYLSALKNDGIDELVEKLSNIAQSKLSATEGTIITNARHFRSEEHTSELQSRENLVCRLL